MRTRSILAGFGAALFAGLAFKMIGKEEPKGMSQSRRFIDRLDPSIRSMAEEVLIRAHAQGIDLVITQGLRTNEEQARLYAQGRTAPGPIVTNAPPGSSWHNFGLAFDVAVLKDGKATWPNDVGLWNQIGAIGKAAGLGWGGDFTSIKDRPHFEYHPGISLAMARTGSRPAA